MMTAVMMKADTRPARRGSNAGESWTIVVSLPTLSCDGPAWVLAWTDVLLGVEGAVDFSSASVEASGRLSVCEAFGDDGEVGGA